MVAVGDQELPVREGAFDPILGKPPQARAVDLKVRVALRAGGGRRALVEEKQRLELGAGLA